MAGKACRADNSNKAHEGEWGLEAAPSSFSPLNAHHKWLQ